MSHTEFLHLGLEISSVVGRRRRWVHVISVASPARGPGPDIDILNANPFKGIMKNPFTFPSGSQDLMSAAISLRQA